MRNLQWWTGAVLFTLMLSLILFAFVARKPLCIDSRIVERIDSVSSSGTSLAYRCALRWHVPYDELLSEQMPSLSRRLQRLERFFDLMGPPQFRWNLTIFQGTSDLYRIQGNEIYLGGSILKAEGQLEKAFLKAWLREYSSADLSGSSLIEESLTDFLYFAMSGDFNLEDPKTGIPLNQELDPKWPRVLTNWNGYCHSLWHTNEDMKVCDDLKSFADDGIQLLSLRPLITQSLNAAYAELPASERIAFLNGFMKSLASLKFHEKDFGLTPVEIRKQSYFEAVSRLENWRFFLSSLSSQVPFADRMANYFDLELKKRGFESSSQLASLDTLVFADSLSESQKNGLLQEMGHLERLLTGIEIKNTLQMSPQGEALSLKLLGTVRASNGVYLHCGSPDLRKLAELSKRVEKLLYVQFCGDQIVYLKGFFEKGVLSFAKQNPGLKFAEFHLPSLLLALRKLPGQNPIQLIAEKKKSSLVPIGWKEPLYDEMTNTYRAQSAIEMVDWYRL